MFRIKASLGALGVLMVLAITAAPAMAEFSSTIGKSQGQIKSFPATTVFRATTAGQPITCKSASGEPKGGWQIQVKTFTQQGKFFYQAPTLTGPHEQLKIEKWGTCQTVTLLPVTVKCNLQIEQSSAGGSGSVYPPGCEAKFGTAENFCAIVIQPDGNKELQKVTLSKTGVSEVEIKSNVENISSIDQENKALCKETGVTGGQKTGTFKTEGGALITEGQTFA